MLTRKECCAVRYLHSTTLMLYRNYVFLSVRLSVTRVDQSKTEQAVITKFLL